MDLSAVGERFWSGQIKNTVFGRLVCVGETYCDTWHIVPCRTPAGPEFDCGRWPIASVRSPSAERPPPWRTPRAPGCSVHTSGNQPQVTVLEFSAKKTFSKCTSLPVSCIILCSGLPLFGNLFFFVFFFTFARRKKECDQYRKLVMW